MILAFFVAFQGAVLAYEVEGTIDSVDAVESSFAVMTEEGNSNISYDAMTTWPEGVTDPNALVGNKVKVTTDETTGVAVLVEKVNMNPDVTPDSITVDQM